MSNLRMIRLFLSSPSDCEPEKQLVREIVEQFNKTHAPAKGLILQAFDWNDVAPGVGYPQLVIDQQLGNYDVLIGLMWLRHGTILPDSAASGTEHEVTEAVETFQKLGQPKVMFYFKNAPPPSMASFDPEQYVRVKQFRRILEAAALTHSFDDSSELRKKLELHLFRVLESFAPDQHSALPHGGNNFRQHEQRRSFIHGPIADNEFINLRELGNPYECLFDPEGHSDSEELLLRLSVVPSLPHSSYLKYASYNVSPAVCCLCIADAEGFLRKSLSCLGDMKDILLAKKPHELWEEEKMKLIETMVHCLENCLVVTGAFSDLVLRTGRQNPAVAYQMIIDSILLPVVSVHRSLGFQRLHLLLPQVGATTGRLIGIAKRSCRSLYPGENELEVKLIEPDSGWQLAAKMARFIDWAVGAAYRQQKPDKKWLKVLESSFGKVAHLN